MVPSSERLESEETHDRRRTDRPNYKAFLDKDFNSERPSNHATDYMNEESAPDDGALGHRPKLRVCFTILGRQSRRLVVSLVCCCVGFRLEIVEAALEVLVVHRRRRREGGDDGETEEELVTVFVSISPENEWNGEEGLVSSGWENGGDCGWFCIGSAVPCRSSDATEGRRRQRCIWWLWIW
ncbi:hypothetical protein HAX54_045324 [Datura stramonium]|uniref:Uncharacterized protein n=1 Tax=Datura stramonium TaxID=4076 RepID=A0ABS8RPD8_DATST|nr:hypothetical protein [Datura stramonium]